MKRSADFAQVCQKFFDHWLPEQRKVSRQTILSYIDCLRLLVQFAIAKLQVGSADLSISNLSGPFIESFLRNLEVERGNSLRTRAQRLAAIRSFFSYVAFEMPQYAALAQRIRGIPAKRMTRRIVPYLLPEELQAVLNAVDRQKWVGRRNYVMIHFTSQTALRNSEVTMLRWRDVDLGRFPNVFCIGKGRKARRTPLTKETQRQLRLWMEEQEGDPGDYVFPSSNGGRLSADAFQKALKKCVSRAVSDCPSLREKIVTPHVLRHTAAMNLYEAGVDIATIAGFLGHESIDTIKVYVEASMKKKEEALRKVVPVGARKHKFRPSDELLTYLSGLSSVSGREGLDSRPAKPNGVLVG